MFNSHLGEGTSPGFHPRDCAAARLAAKQQSLLDIADWLEKAPKSANDSFRTVTLTLSFSPCTETAGIGGIAGVRSSCTWVAKIACSRNPVTPPAGKTSAFNPSSRFTLLQDQYYEAAGTARGEDIVNQDRACTDAEKKAHSQVLESAGKAGLCDQEDAAMQIAISLAPARPALIGGGRYTIGEFEAVCDWNIIIQAVNPARRDARPSGCGSSAASGIRS
jgi:hypothetical protein